MLSAVAYSTYLLMIVSVSVVLSQIIKKLAKRVTGENGRKSGF